MIRTKKNLGEDIAKDVQRIKEWRETIDKLESQKLESIRQRELHLEQERRNYLTDKRANIDFTGKLLKISQENPELWREIKDEMYQKRLMEEKNMNPKKSISLANSNNLGLKKTEGQDIDVNSQIVLVNQGMKEVISDLGGQMARDAEARLNAEENKAANKLQKKYRDQKKDSKACGIF